MNKKNAEKDREIAEWKPLQQTMCRTLRFAIGNFSDPPSEIFPLTGVFIALIFVQNFNE